MIYKIEGSLIWKIWIELCYKTNNERLMGDFVIFVVLIGLIMGMGDENLVSFTLLYAYEQGNGCVMCIYAYVYWIEIYLQK